MALTKVTGTFATLLATSTNRTLYKERLLSGVLVNTGQVSGDGACYLTISRTVVSPDTVASVCDDSEANDTIKIPVLGRVRLPAGVTAFSLDTGASGTATFAWIPDNNNGGA